MAPDYSTLSKWSNSSIVKDYQRLQSEYKKNNAIGTESSQKKMDNISKQMGEHRAELATRGKKLAYGPYVSGERLLGLTPLGTITSRYNQSNPTVF